MPLRLPIFGLITLAVSAQGLPPEWEVRKMLDEVTGQTKRLAPMVAQLDPQRWVAAGAPEAYVAQRQSLLEEIGYLEHSAKALAAKFDRMSLALECHTRLSTIESRMMSLTGAVRRYQNPALADLLESLMSETSGSREKFRQYAWELVAAREQEFDVLQQEAQRCRGGAVRATPAPARPVASKPPATGAAPAATPPAATPPVATPPAATPVKK